jgi:anti-sigma regulatory factor (Ser/Thr protein kinase)
MALDGEKHPQADANEEYGVDPDIIKIDDEFAIYTIQKAATKRAEKIGMSLHDLNELEIIIRELVTNVQNHGGRTGHIVISHQKDKNSNSIIIDVVDKGPGFKDFSQALEDGFSSTGSMGGGLPSVRRFSERVELLKNSSHGSHIRVVKRATFNDMEVDTQWSFALFSKPYPGKLECGDIGTLIRNQEGILLVLADGLGHGNNAALASRKAVDVVHSSHRLTLEEILISMHHKMKKTRGSAVSLLRILPDSHKIEWLGIGNVSGRIIRIKKDGSLEQTVFANYNGTVGYQLNNYKKLYYNYSPGDWLLLTSDGIISNWEPIFENNFSNNPYTMGQAMIKLASRDNDDSSVLIGRSIG